MTNFDSFNRNQLFSNKKASTSVGYNNAANKVNRTSLENVRERMYKIDVNKMPKPAPVPEIKTNDTVGKTQNMRNINLNSNFNRKSW